MVKKKIGFSAIRLKQNRMIGQFRLPFLLLSIGVISISIGCSRQVYVPVEHVRVDTLRVAKVNCDTLLRRDSVFLAVKGDTVVKEVYKWRFRSHLKVDTLYRTRTDTVLLKVSDPTAGSAATRMPSFLATLLDWIKWISRISFMILVGHLALRLRNALKGLRA